MPHPIITVVNACLRDGAGGSPTAVLDEAPLSDDERRSIPVRMGTSHAVFVEANEDGSDGRDVSLRFFTSEGELPACGHGTVAALAFLAARAGGEGREVALRTAGRTVTGQVVRRGPLFEAHFEPGPVDLREPTVGELDLVLPSLGVAVEAQVASGSRVAALGRARLLVPISTRSALAALDPDFGGLREACDRLGLLGCYVYCEPDADGRTAARMFAPAIGVPEDLANANSTACLAAHLARESAITVEMGDSLGTPCAVTASTSRGSNGPVVRVGGTAQIVQTLKR